MKKAGDIDILNHTQKLVKSWYLCFLDYNNAFDIGVKGHFHLKKYFNILDIIDLKLTWRVFTKKIRPS